MTGKLHYRESPTLVQKQAFKPYLSEDEDLILVTGLSRAYIRTKALTYLFFPGLIFGALGFALGLFLRMPKEWAAALGLFLMMLFSILKTLHVFHANRYLLTTRRIIIKNGLFSVKLTAALYDKITHLEVDQSFVERILLHHGNIIVNTAGLNKGEIVLRFIDYPMEIKNLLERLINRERERYGGVGVSSFVEGEILG